MSHASCGICKIQVTYVAWRAAKSMSLAIIGQNGDRHKRGHPQPGSLFSCR